MDDDIFLQDGDVDEIQDEWKRELDTIGVGVCCVCSCYDHDIFLLQEQVLTILNRHRPDHISGAPRGAAE